MLGRKLFVCLFAYFAITAVPATAQNIAYRQANLASDLADGFSDNLNPLLKDTWGISAFSQRFFLVANSQNGRVVTLDASGIDVRPGAFVVPSLAGTGNGTVRGIVADTDLAFAAHDSNQFVSAAILATAQGGLYLWGEDAQGNFPTEAVLKVDKSQSGALYTALAILAPSCCAPMLAVADFHAGTVQLFDTNFAPSGTLTDPNLPPGFVPFGMQVVGNQLFVTFGLQDAEKQNPIPGAGNGIVSVFDLSGHFVRRFATSGPLNAPWGITQAGADFGPFANAVLIANAGDGVINAFDFTSGEFLGRIQDGDGNPIRNARLHGLIFSSPDLGKTNRLYFTAGINNDQDGLFGTISTGLVSMSRVDALPPVTGKSDRISISVSAGPGNTGIPGGSVSIADDGVPIGEARLAEGSATLDVVFTTPGTHTLSARYQGDGTFLPSTSQMDVVVSGAATSITLNAPPTAAVGSAILLTASVRSDSGIPTGLVDFHDGGASLGTAPLDDTGVAKLRTNALTAGMHSLTASYEGDSKFAGSTSSPVTTDVATPDFSLVANRTTATAVVGQPTQFVLTITPSAGFNENVSFLCAAGGDVTCSFAPASVTPGNGSANTTLTVTVSARSASAGSAAAVLSGWTVLAASAVLLLLVSFGTPLWRMQPARLLTAGALLFMCAMPMLFAGCGGSGSNSASTHRIAVVQITANGRTVSHTTTVSITVQ